MKKALALTGLAVALFALPVAAQADVRSGITITIGSSKVLPAAASGWRYGTDYNDYRTHQGRIMPLANVVRDLERKTNATVTDIKLSRDKRFYEFEGVTQRGFLVTAKASAATGAVGGISVKNYKPRYDARATSISPLLASLRNKGYHSFDLVSLKEEKGVYQVRGLNRQGKPVMIRAAARTGKVLSTRNAPGYNGPSYAQAEYRDFGHWQKGLTQQKYSSFTNVVAYDDYYAVKARDGRGRPVNLSVCPFTGKVLDARY
ncbi:hypothetical protein Plav_1977 [Parvibaculum lavamentivorans DS-1]|uniref:PepSY domain-containing protein n=1 Tax=Parvibaculum lavamentivorans (strain DS-1 / DSM 13023 / NCIMB 13966) TaxID=402881 RepID=A7HUK8_PARL1|nr:hypothetical protein [Parvibaculum lavamentivorans]ABS63591.1 hypothetical protein Plav_1977 [Parvibaculum lavamentivorans DS-1]